MATTPAGLHHLLERERLRGVRRINTLRFWGVSAFFALFLLLGGVLRLPAWQGNLGLFSLYWIIAAAVLWVTRGARRGEGPGGALTALTIALVDTPIVFLLQWSTFPTSPSASGIAGFTVGVYVLFVILATLSLERRYILTTAAAGAVFEVLLQHLAGVSAGAMVSTVMLIGLATGACLHARGRVERLVERVEAAAQVDAARRSTEDRLRETTALLGIAQTLGGVTEVPEALRRICRELAKLTGAETVAAYLVDRERAELRPAAAYRSPKPLLRDFARTALPLQGAAFSAALEHGRLVWSNRVPERPELALWPPDRFPLQSALIVPLTVDDKVAGLFYLVWWTAQHHFDPAGLALAEAVGRQVGGFIQTARLYQELDRSRRRSVQVERLRALGEMAAGVAHDFNNLLAIILGRAELLLHSQPPAAPAAERRPIELIVQAARDGARTVRRIQEFTRRTPRGPLGRVDLGEVVRDVIEMTRARWDDEAQAHGICYEVAAEGDETPPVRADAAELREALTNLVLNGLDAMPSGGRLTLRTAAEGPRVRCEVADTGLGMPAHVRERAFEPFFSTKLEKGSGLGLSIVYGIVTRLGGEIAVESTPGAGSTFILWLPVATDAPEEAEDTPAVTFGPRALHVLVVDDDAEVREVIADALTSEGHRSLACADAASALRALESEPFDVVLTDLGMPGIGGWGVAAAVKRLRPGTPVGLVTGWGEAVDPTEAAARGVDFVVAKPFELGQLRAVLAGLATAPGARRWSPAGTSSILDREADPPRRGTSNGKGARGHPDRRSDPV